MSRLYLWIALLPVLWTHSVHAVGSVNTWSSPTTLDVVLVTFDDETTANPMTPMSCGNDRHPRICDYHEHDRPHGSNDDGTYPDPDSSYTRRDFERLFSGGYGTLPDFIGTDQTVGNRHPLPKVFGSVRAYFDSVSNGNFVLNVRMINPIDDNGYPRWIELPNTKAHYAETASNHVTRTDFWDELYETAMDSVSCWSPYVPDPSDVDCGDSEVSDYAITDIPGGPTDTLDRRRRHKVVYLYSGATYIARDPVGLLHPQADMVTLGTPGNPSRRDQIGYRYVMGEREGWGEDDHDIDEFVGIFIHAHEIGHLLGLVHPGGQWRAPNPYTEALLDTNYNTANLMDWGLMQGSGAGPQVTDSSNTERLYHRAYRSCPNPINPFYRIDLGWLSPTDITESRDNYVIEPGTVHRITRPTNDGRQVEYLLERRTHDGMESTVDGEEVGGRSFGRYVSYHEYENTDPGLFIWRRHSNRERPILIVADDRRFMNARDRDWTPTIPEYQDMRYDPFPVEANTVWTMVSGSLHTSSQDAVDAVGSHMGGIGLRRRLDDHRQPGQRRYAMDLHGANRGDAA